MTTQLAPTPVFKAFDNNGLPLANGMLYSYIAGTTTPQATYTDSTGSTPNANPVVLNARGEANVWLNPTQGYKLVLTDSLGNQIWSVDGIIGPVNINQSLIPAADNTYSLGSTTAAWAQLYLGANHAPALNGGIVGYWPQTAAEFAAGVTPMNYAYEPSAVVRYGADPSGNQDSTAAINASFAVFAQGGPEPVFVQGIFKITTALNVPASLILDLRRATIRPSGAINAFTLTNNPCGIVNGIIDMSASSGMGVYGDTLQQLLFRDLQIQASSGLGMQLLNCYDTILDTVRFMNGTGNALDLESTISGTPINSTWLRGCKFTNFGGTEVVKIVACAGVYVLGCDFENNDAADSDDVYLDQVNQVVLRDCYFEHGVNFTGNCVYLNSGQRLFVEGNYFQTSKQQINLSGLTSNDAHIVHNTFMQVTGSPNYAVLATGFYPDCYGNSGSVADLNRSWTPGLTFGGGAVSMTGTFDGQWARQGDVLKVWYDIILTAKGTSTGQAAISGLPLAPVAAALDAPAVCRMQNVSSISGTTYTVANPGLGTNAYIYGQNSTGEYSINDTYFGNTSRVSGGFEYQI